MSNEDVGQRALEDHLACFFDLYHERMAWMFGPKQGMGQNFLDVAAFDPDRMVRPLFDVLREEHSTSTIALYIHILA